MQPSSAEFNTLVRKDHRYAARAVIATATTLLVAPGKFDDSQTSANFEILDGSVTIDRNSDTRRTASLKVLDLSGLTKYMLDPIVSSEVELYRGIILESTGQPEWIPLGRFIPTDMHVDRDGASVVVDVQLADRSERIRQNPLRTVYQVATGTNQMTALGALYTNRAAGFTPFTNLMTTTKTSPDVFYTEQDDVWQVLMAMATAASGELWHDAVGSLNCYPVPDPNDVNPAYQFSQDDVLLTPIGRDVSRRDVYSGVIVRGEAPWLLFPISGEAWDDDPFSPTYRLGPFGEKPKIIGNAIASTNGECATIAASEFAKIKGVSENISFKIPVDPRLDVYDVLQIIDADIGIAGRYGIESLTIPLLEGAMSGVVKRRR